MKSQNFYTFTEYMKENKLTISEEDYLEMIYRLCINNNLTRVNEIAQSINVKAPSVTNMLKRLVEKKLVIHVEYGIVKLTDEGKKIGALLLERHLIVEDFLKIINVNDNLLEETEKIEHTVSPTTILKIKQLVTFFDENENIKLLFNQFIND